MKTSHIAEEMLKQRLFDALKTNDASNTTEINDVCGKIASAVIALSTEISVQHLDSYTKSIELLHAHVKEFDQNLGKAVKIIKDSFPGDDYEVLRDCIDTPIIQKLTEQGILKRDKEEDKTIDFDHNAKLQNIKNMLRNKQVAQQGQFVEKGVKQAGVSAGYIAKEKDTDNTFILKQFYKKHDYCLEEPDEEKRRQRIDDRRDGVREWLGSAMYQFLLYDRAPKEGLVIPDEANPKSLYVRSKFFNDVTSVGEFSRKKKIRAVEGLEKLVASCHMLGELDYHSGNIMVQKQIDDNNQERHIFTKIDHGRSLADFNADFGSMIDKTYQNFSDFGYGKGYYNLPFNVEKYSEALSQMTHSFNEEQIDSIVDHRVAELKKAGFDPNGLEIYYRFDKSGYVYSTLNSHEGIASSYKSLLKANLSNMRRIANQVEIITKFSNVTPEFKNGEWLKAFATSEFKDPIVFAARNNIQIEGKNPLQWAHDKGYKIEYPVRSADLTETREMQWQKQPDGKWSQEEVIVSKPSITIKTIEPLGYISIAISALGYDKQLSKSEIEFASQAAEFGLKYDARVNYKEALDVLGIKPDSTLIARTHNKDKKISEEKLLPLIDSFVKTHTTTREVTKSDIAKLYDDLIVTLKKDGYITDKDIDAVKARPNTRTLSNFEKIVDSTFDLVKITTPQITGSDKLKYNVANFCKSIRLTGIANYCMQKISPDNLSKIHDTEKLLVESIKIKELLSGSISKEGISGKRIENIQSIAATKLLDRASMQKGSRSVN
jgi:hypothetical protein